MPNAMSAPSFESLAARHGERYKWLLLLVVACGMIAGVLSTTSFSVAIPALTRHFGLGQSQVQWAITVFMAAMTIAMLPVAWLIDRFGFRVVFLSAISVLLMSSIAGSLTTSFSAVVAARIVQGAAAGMLQPLGPLAVMRLFPSTVQGRASGVLGFGIVLAPATAPALGGVLLDQFGWHAIFLLDLPFCLLAAVLGLRLLPAPRERLSKPFDWGGMGLLTLITVALIEGVAGLAADNLAAGLWGMITNSANDWFALRARVAESDESEATRRLYGLDQPRTEDFGRKCLLARRLVERGVRVVQVYYGAGQPWDTHSRNAENLRNLCAMTDRPSAGLVTDLKRRGLLDDTIVMWTTVSGGNDMPSAC